MTRSQFLDQLRRGLVGLKSQDVADIIADYNVHFDEGLAKGRSEEEIADKLGDPARLARELRAEAQVRAWEEKPTPYNFFAVLFAFIGLAAIDFVVLLPVLGWLALFALITLVVCVCLVIGGIAALVSLLHVSHFANLGSGVARFATGVGLVAFGTAVAASLLLFAQWVVGLLVKFARLHYRLLKQVDNGSR